MKFRLMLVLGSLLFISPTFAGRAHGQNGHGGGGGGGTSVAMGRLRTIGWETKGYGDPFFEGGNFVVSGGGSISVDTATARTGNASLKASTPAGTGQAAAVIQLKSTEAVSGSGFIYTRVYFMVDSFPDSGFQRVLFSYGESAGPFGNCAVDVFNNGTNTVLQFRNASSNLIGTSTALSLNTWYRLEVALQPSTNGIVSYCEARLDGVSFGSTAGNTGTSLEVDQIILGNNNVNTSSTNCNYHFDDLAINSSTGATQNSWPGEGEILLLLPSSDHARTGWTGGAGGTTNLFQGVDNTPPVGMAKASETNASQIKDGTSSATDNYDANLTDYTTGGVPTNATVTLVQAAISQGSESTAGTDAGALLVVSNPAQSVEDTFNFNKSATVGTWPTGWVGVWGSAQVGDVSNRAAGPVLRIGKRTATNRADDCSFMGLMVEYTLPVVATLPHRLALLGVGH